MGSLLNPNITQGVNLGFTALMVVPLSVIMCITYGRAPRSTDLARVTVTYFKIMLPFAIAYIVMFSISAILGLIDLNVSYYGGGYAHMQEAQLRISAIGALCSRLMDIFLIMTLVEMGNGFLFCLNEMRTGLQKAMRYVAIGTCAILAALAIALFGVTNAEYSSYLGYHGYTYDYSEQLYDSRKKLSSALYILIFIWSLVLLVFAAIVFNKAKRNYVLKNSAMLFLIATVLYFVSNLYNLIYTARFILRVFYFYDSSSYDTYTALMFIDPIFTVWLFTAAVSLVCVVVIRKNNGLWSTVQPWMNAQIPPALAANPGYKGAGEQWQQPSNSHVVGV